MSDALNLVSYTRKQAQGESCIAEGALGMVSTWQNRFV